MASSAPPSQAPTAGLAHTLGVLRRNPDFGRLYGALLVSFMGDWFATVALLDLVQEVTGRDAAAGLVLALQVLPLALVAPVAGVVLDRLDRRLVMILADVLRVGLALGFLLARSPGTIWIAYVCIIGISGLAAFFEPAASASVPNLVRREDLAGANLLVGSAWGTMLAVGAALGGIVTATLGRDAAFIGNAVSFGVSALLLLGARAPFRSGDPKGGRITIGQDIREGLGVARRSHVVLSLLIVKGGFGVAAGVLTMLAVFSERIFDTGAAGTGMLMSARGLGVLAGPFVFRRIFGMEGARLFVAIGVAFVCFAGGYMVFGIAPTIVVAAAAVFVAHLGGGAQWAFSTYGLQVHTPDHVRGRVFAFDYAFVTFTLALSVFGAGLAAERFDPRPVAVGIAALALVWAAVWTAATTPVRRAAARARAGAR